MDINSSKKSLMMLYRNIFFVVSCQSFEIKIGLILPFYKWKQWVNKVCGVRRWVLLLSEGNALQVPLRGRSRSFWWDERKRGEEWGDKSVVPSPFQYLLAPSVPSFQYPVAPSGYQVLAKQEWMPFSSPNDTSLNSPKHTLPTLSRVSIIMCEQWAVDTLSVSLIFC